MKYSSTFFTLDAAGKVGAVFPGGATIPLANQTTANSKQTLRWTKDTASGGLVAEVIASRDDSGNSTIAATAWNVNGNAYGETRSYAGTSTGVAANWRTADLTTYTRWIGLNNAGSSFIQNPNGLPYRSEMNFGTVTGIPAIAAGGAVTVLFNHGLYQTPKAVIPVGSIIYTTGIDFMNSTQVQVRIFNGTGGPTPAGQSLYWVAVT